MFRIPKKCHLLMDHYGKVLLAALVATALGSFLTTKLSLQSDLAELLPDSFDSVQELNRMRSELGSLGQLRIVIESQDFDAARRFAEDLGPRLLASPVVRYVDYKNDTEFYRRNALLFLDTLRLDSLRNAIEDRIEQAKQELNPLFVDDLFGDEPEVESASDLGAWADRYGDLQPKPYYTNADSTVLVVKVFPSEGNTDLTFIQSMLDEVTAIVDSVGPAGYDPAMQIYYGGNFKNRLDEFAVLKSDIFGTAVYGLSGVFLLIVIYFRRFVGAVLISASLLVSLSWTFGLTYLVIGQLNTITAFLFVILFGLGIDYGIHAFARYVEGRQSGMELLPAIEAMVCQTGSALATTAITTSAAFFSLMFMDFRGFSDLGFIAGVGMIFALVAMVLVLPSLIILSERMGILRIHRAEHKDFTLRREPFAFANVIIMIAVPLTLLAAWGFSRTDFEYDFTNLRANTPMRQIVGEKTRGVFTLSESPAVIMTDTRDEIDAVMAAVRRTMREDTLTPTVDQVRSVFSLVPADQDARLVKIAEIRDLLTEDLDDVVTGRDAELLDELRAYAAVDQPFTWDDFPEKDRRQFINKRGEIGNFVFIYPGVALRDGRNAIEFRNDIGEVVTENGSVYHSASSNIVSAEMLVIMISEGKTAVLISGAVVFLIVLFDFRSLRAALLVLSPLAVGVLWMGGIMDLTGMKLNLFNIVVIPSIIGIGVDNGVHIYHRYLENGRGSLRFVLRHTGIAILMTTLTTIVGYSGLIMASHPGLNSIGMLAVIGITTTFLSAVILLPALIERFAPVGARGPSVEA